MSYRLDLKHINKKNIYSLGNEFAGSAPSGETLSFTNYYLERNGKPFFGISGEFHYSRMNQERWEEELVKMKMGGINVVSTYCFWNHHEEIEGQFVFEGRKNVRHFVELCQKHGLYVILRVGPFCHGETRNGGLPDWLYGKPFEVRSLQEGFLYHVERLYTQIGQQVKGLFYPDGGPVIGVQIDNEYMHSAAPWEMTVGTTDEWMTIGQNGDAYMLALQKLAAKCGLLPVFYTCTGWGGASTPKSMMPLWGGYSFRPWLFYSRQGEHPATDEYVYQDFHNNAYQCNYDFHPAYDPEEKPYACCEMGGGMMCSYYYRFQFDYKSVDAMANIKVGSGCNFLGYYMYQGGTNPTGVHGQYMNEGQVAKLSYDYQAALGEYGQKRESYDRLRTLHYFLTSFTDKLADLPTVLPVGASYIDPKDDETLRYAVRTDGKRGFLFVNNYQDHFALSDRKEASVTLELQDEELTFAFDLASGENAILPFHFDMDGINLIMATAQPLTKLAEEDTYVFLIPEGMKPEFRFEPSVEMGDLNIEEWYQWFTVKKASETEHRKIKIMLLTRAVANDTYVVNGKTLIYTNGTLMADKDSWKVQYDGPELSVACYPQMLAEDKWSALVDEQNHMAGEAERKLQEHPIKVTQVGPHRHVLQLPNISALQLDKHVKEYLLELEYDGDVGHAFIHGQMIHDNFANGAPWVIGLNDFKELLEENDYQMTIYISPLKKGARVNVESAMAARLEEVDEELSCLKGARLCPVFETELV